MSPGITSVAQTQVLQLWTQKKGPPMKETKGDNNVRQCHRTPRKNETPETLFHFQVPMKSKQASKQATSAPPNTQPSSPVADSPIPPNGFLHPVSINNMCCNFTTSGVLLYQNLGYRLHYSTTVFHYMFTTFLLHFAFRVHFVSGSVIRVRNCLHLIFLAFQYNLLHTYISQSSQITTLQTCIEVPRNQFQGLIFRDFLIISCLHSIC